MGTITLEAAAMAKAQADRDYELAVEAARQAPAGPHDDEEIANLRLALASAVSALGLSLRYGMSAATRRVVRSSYRLGCAQLEMEHD